MVLSLFSKWSDNDKVNNTLSTFAGDNLEFFMISLHLHFDIGNNLITITPGAGVRKELRQKGIFSSVTIAALEKINKHLGSEITQIASDTSILIATKKFFYPLALFYRKSTSESLMNFNLESHPLPLDDIEKRHKLPDIFQEDLGAKCPDRSLPLRKLLLQYRVRNILQKHMNIDSRNLQVTFYVSYPESR